MAVRHSYDHFSTQCASNHFHFHHQKLRFIAWVNTQKLYKMLPYLLHSHFFFFFSYCTKTTISLIDRCGVFSGSIFFRRWSQSLGDGWKNCDEIEKKSHYPDCLNALEILKINWTLRQQAATRGMGKLTADDFVWWTTSAIFFFFFCPLTSQKM